MSIKGMFHPKTGKYGYFIRVSLGKVDGKHRYRSKFFYARDITEAQQKESDMEQAARNCRRASDVAEVYRAYLKHLPKANISLKEAFEKSQAKPGMISSEEKIRVKKSYWQDFLAWMKKNNPLVRNVSDVTPAMAENYIAHIRKNGRFIPVRGKKLSVYTLNDIHLTCRRVFKALRNETGVQNPFSDIPLLKNEKDTGRKAYTDEQVAVIFEKADNEYMKPLFFIGLFTGLSEGDICTLRKDEIFFDRRHIYRLRNKTGVMSSIPMLPVLQKYLEDLCNDPANTSEYVLPKHCQLYNQKSYQISRDIKNFLEIDCGFETSINISGRSRKVSTLDFHSLRHTFCSMAGVVGIPLTVVQSIVGHMTPAMTKLYSRHIDEKSRLHWIDLFGQKIASLPIGITVSQEDKKELLLDKIATMDITQINDLFNLVNQELAQ